MVDMDFSCEEEGRLALRQPPLFRTHSWYRVAPG